MTMEDFKNLSYYDQLREIERQLVKLQDSYRRISSVPQSQPMDLISDLQANPPHFQSIKSIEEPIEGILESPRKELTCDSRDFASGGSEHPSRRNGSATNPRILSQDSSVPRSSWNNINRGGNVRTSKQPEEYSRHMDGLQRSIVQKSKKLEIDVSESSLQSIRIPVPLNQRINLNLGAQSTFSITNYWGSMEQAHKLLSSSEIGIGNVKFLEFEFLEFDGMKCGGLVRDCEKPDFYAFGVSLGSWNLDLHPQVVDGNVGSKAMEFRVMNQPFLNAHEVFEKMSEKEMVNVDDSIGLPSTLRGVFWSIDFPSSIIFDPGKGLQLSPHIKTVETIFVFDPGGLDFQWLVWCVVTDCVDVVAEFLLPYSY